MGALAIKSNVSYYLDEYTNKINEATQQIKSNYIYIGFLLNELANSEKFSHEPYTIAEYAENEFGFSKSLTYSMMKVSERFCHGMFLSDRFKNYGYSQLVELLSVSNSDLEKFDSGMSVREIKEKKRELKEKYASRVSFQTSGKEKGIEKEDKMIVHSSDGGFVNISLFNTEYTVDEFGMYVCDVIQKYCRDGRKYVVRIMVNDL